MITPWEIYWVLQLDSISNALALLFGIAAGGCLFSGFMWGMLSDLCEDRTARLFKRLAIFIFPPIFFVALTAHALMPSTKTAAAMFVVPAIVNNPTIQHEAGDLYKLAKEALRDAIVPRHKDK